MSTGHTFEPGDRVRHAKGAVGTFVEFPAEGLVCTVRWDGWTIDDTAQHVVDLSPVVVTAKHVGKRARITDQDGVTDHRGRRGVMRMQPISGKLSIQDDDGDYWTFDEGCAVLVADEPAAAAGAAPQIEVRAEQWRVGSADLFPHLDAGWLAQVVITPEGGQVAIFQRPEDAQRAVAAVNGPDVATETARSLTFALDGVREDRDATRAMLDRDRRALARVKTQRDEARAEVQCSEDRQPRIDSLTTSLKGQRDNLVRQVKKYIAERDEARAELAAHRAVPDPAVGLTVTPDGQRVVDADGVPVVGRADRSVRWMQRDADQSNRIAVALRLLADHAEAAEATPTVDEDAEARAVFRAMYGGDGSTWTRVEEQTRDSTRRIAAAARAARTGDGA